MTEAPAVSPAVAAWSARTLRAWARARYSFADAERLAAARNGAHAPTAVSQFDDGVSGEARNLVGVLGEIAFAHRYGYPLDETVRPAGDGGVDFWTTLGSVDVRTIGRRYPVCHLLQRAARPVVARLYVLAAVDSTGRAALLLGWTTGGRLAEAPLDTGARARYTASRSMPESELWPMDVLDELYRTAEARRRAAPEAFAASWREALGDTPLPPWPEGGAAQEGAQA